MTNIVLAAPRLINFLQAFGLNCDSETADQAASLLEKFGFDIKAVAKLNTAEHEAKLITGFVGYLISTHEVALPNWSFDQWSLNYTEHLNLHGYLSVFDDAAAKDDFQLIFNAEICCVVTDVEDAKYSLNHHHYSEISFKVANHKQAVTDLSTMIDYQKFLENCTPIGLICLKRELTQVLTNNHDLTFAVVHDTPYASNQC